MASSLFAMDLLNAYIDYKDRQAAVPPLISGNDLIAVFGLSPSPRFKHILNRVNERRLSGELTTRDQALKWVDDHLLSLGIRRTGGIRGLKPEEPRTQNPNKRPHANA
jgi:hypothetical protein